MKEATISVPTGTFPAVVGDRVRVSLRNLNGLETVDALVVKVVKGCGVADRVSLRYDETLLPYGVVAVLTCNITGFQKLCDCCGAKMCYEVFGPTEIVREVTRHVFLFPGDFRLDQIKLYSPNPAQVPLLVQVWMGDTMLFPHHLEMTGKSLTVNRAAFSADFSHGLIPAASKVKLQIVGGPEEMYYQTPWKGVTLCLNGVWQPHSLTLKGSLRRSPGVRPDPDTGTYPGGVYVTDGEGNFVTDGEGNYVTP